MKYQKLVNDLNNLLDSANRQHHKRQEKMKFYRGQFKAEEKILRKKLEKETNIKHCRRLEKELGMVKDGFKVLDSNV